MEKADTLQMRTAAARVLTTSPGLAEKIATNQKSAGEASTPFPGAGAERWGMGDKDSMIFDLTRQLDVEKDKNRQLEDQFKYRVGSFIKRETQAKKTIEALEAQLMERTDDEHRQRMGVIRNMHDSVVNGLEEIQNRTAKTLQEQEKDLMRAFRARLQDVFRELETQRTAKGDYSAEIQARHRRVVSELHASQELAQIFDKKNLSLQTDNQKLQDQLRTREDDRQALVKELVLAKREVSRLKQQLEAETGEGRLPQVKTREKSPPRGTKPTGKAIDQGRLQCSRNAKYERELQYRQAIARLKRLYQQTRAQVDALKDQQNKYVQNRTELEILLTSSLEDVKMEIARKEEDAREQGKRERPDSAGGTPAAGPKIDPEKRPRSVTVYDMTSEDRERVLELLLSQQRVVQLLYNKTFPKKPPTPTEDEPPEDFAWLESVLKE